ncbi:MAG: hypothetical protein GY714_28440 [Desulfobacterales bacterium]|nr:hypothetical protein [Desulfobacterales bacterium]
MNVISLFNRKDEKREIPWRYYPSIYSHIKKNLDSKGKLKPAGEKLPDDERFFKPGDLRWVAGGLDGALGRHSSGSNTEEAEKVAKLIVEIAKTGEKSKKIDLYNLLKEDSLLDFLDSSLELIIEKNPEQQPYLYDFARWLILKSPDRGPLKFGISLMGLLSDVFSLEDLIILSKHEEFTLFSATALSNTLAEPETILWDIAKKVDGWGRIHLVERLLDTKSSEIKSWFITEGYKNSIMYEYLAYSCAVAGDLHLVLSKPVISLNMIESAGEIIRALIAGGPAEDIDDYEHAADLIFHYIEHLESHATSIQHFLNSHDILEFIQEEDSWKDRAKINGWDRYERNDMEASLKRIIENPRWKLIVSTSLGSLNYKENLLFWEITRAAKLLNINVWGVYWKKLNKMPHDQGSWYDIMVEADHSKIDEVLSFAKEVLPLSELSTGPSDDMGFGDEFNLHSCLDCILQELREFPGKGFEFIKTGFKSPVVRNRNMSLQALYEWGKDNWPSETESFLESIIDEEPEEDIRKNIKKLIKGTSIN